MFALPNEQVERRDFNSLIGVGEKDLEAVRKVAQSRLELGDGRVANLDCVSRLRSTGGGK